MDKVCPAGRFCANAQSSAPCPVGHYCLAGGNRSTRCSSDLFGLASAAARCPLGTVHEPATLGYALLALAIWLTVLAAELVYAHAGACCRGTRNGEPIEGQLELPQAEVQATELVCVGVGAEGAEGEGAEGGVEAEVPAAAAEERLAGLLPGFPEGRAFVTLQFEALDFHIGKAHVLKSLTACVREGELTALMGESGSGKTSLLNVLAGRAAYGVCSGQVRGRHESQPTRVY